MLYDLCFKDQYGNQVGKIHTTDDMTCIAGLMYSAQMHADSENIELFAHFREREHIIKITPRRVPRQQSLQFQRTNTIPAQSKTACEIIAGGG